MPFHVALLTFQQKAFYVFYHGLILLAFILFATLYFKRIRNSLHMVILLALTLIVESYTGYYYFRGTAHQPGIDTSWSYHVFNLFDYLLFCMYYIRNCREKRYFGVVKITIPVFTLFGLVTSALLYHFSGLPAFNINVEGFLLTIIYTHLLFSIDVDLRMFIFTHPDFWMAIGVLAYYGGVFVFFNLYNTLLPFSRDKTIMMFLRITEPLNVILYICIIISSICTLWNRKYLAQ